MNRSEDIAQEIAQESGDLKTCEEVKLNVMSGKSCCCGATCVYDLDARASSIFVLP